MDRDFMCGQAVQVALSLSCLSSFLSPSLSLHFSADISLAFLLSSCPSLSLSCRLHCVRRPQQPTYKRNESPLRAADFTPQRKPCGKRFQRMIFSPGRNASAKARTARHSARSSGVRLAMASNLFLCNSVTPHALEAFLRLYSRIILLSLPKILYSTSKPIPHIVLSYCDLQGST